MTVTVERLPPPSSSVGARAWLRQNMFSGWASSLVTIVLGMIIVSLIVLIAEWALTQARWGVITTNLRLFLIGLYPIEEAWRVWLTLVVVSILTGLTAVAQGGRAMRTLASGLAGGQALLGLLALLADMGLNVSGALLINTLVVWLSFAIGVRFGVRSRALGFLWLASVPVLFLLMQGLGLPLLPMVSTHLWGGLLLTFLLSVGGIALAFPFGVLLALGRRSDLPAVRLLSTAYIEIIRGVPLVTMLFMAAILLPLFLPADMRIEHVFRAMVGITLFSAAYVAENVRGGLQAIPSGQIEAANAIGLNAYQRNVYIVLPQALRAVIPANVGLFISLLKDTTLVAIAGTGLLELLGIGGAVIAQPEWIGAAARGVRFHLGGVLLPLLHDVTGQLPFGGELGVGKR